MGWLDFLKGKKEEPVVKKEVEVKKQAAVEKVEIMEQEKKVVVCGVEMDRTPSNEQLIELVNKITPQLGLVLPTEQDVYWFVIEQYDQIRSFSVDVSMVTQNIPFKLLPMEYEGRKSINSYVGKANPGMVFMEQIVKPDLLEHFQSPIIERLITTIYSAYCNWMKDTIQTLRVKYASHYRDNCIAEGNNHAAERWTQVIAPLTKSPVGDKANSVFLFGVELERMPADADELTEAMVKAAATILPHIETEEDMYWFVVEQYDRIASCGDTVALIMATYPFQMFEIEYSDRKSENSYVGHKNPAIVHILNSIAPDLVRHYGVVPAQSMLAFIFGTYLNGNAMLIKPLRLKYAVQFHNQCIASKNFYAADKWNEVIEALDTDYHMS